MFEAELREIGEVAGAEKSEHILWQDWSGVAQLTGNFNMLPLSSAIAAAPLDKLDKSTRKDFVERCVSILEDIQHTATRWCWQSRKAAGTGPAVVTFNSARLLTESMPCGAVVLDATADVDVTYQLFGDRMKVLSRPANARRYDNVTLHLSANWPMGKHSRLKTMEADASRLIGYLNQRLGPDDAVLIATHLGIESAFKAHETKFICDIGHWNALDGRNDWQEHGNVVIFTLPYRPTVWAPNMFMAARGVHRTQPGTG